MMIPPGIGDRFTYFILGVAAATIHPSWRKTPVYYIIIGMCLLAVLIGGCGYQSSKVVVPDAPHTGLVHNPTVVLIGDSVMGSWVTPALGTNPLWIAQVSPQGVQETSAEILARFPLAVAVHPDIIVLEAGTWDMAPPDQPDFMCQGTSAYPWPCLNIQSMIQEAKSANIYLIVCAIPPWGNGPLATEINTADPPAPGNSRQQNIGFYTSTLLGYAAQDVVLVDFYTLLSGESFLGQGADDIGWYYLPQYTTDGVNPNAAGAAAMVQATQTAIQHSQVGIAR